MLFSGTDPESYITEYTLVYEDNFGAENNSVSPYCQGKIGWERLRSLGISFACVCPFAIGPIMQSRLYLLISDATV